MVQKNEMSARALTMDELENVNGGRVSPVFALPAGWDDGRPRRRRRRIKK
jgi:hypothetical protein